MLIYDPSAFTDTLSNASWTEEFRGAVPFLRVMRKALGNSLSEQTHSYGRTFDPTTDQLPDGTVLILDGEALIGSFVTNGDPATGTYQEPKPSEAPMPSKPYLEYWRGNVGTPDVGLLQLGESRPEKLPAPQKAAQARAIARTENIYIVPRGNPIKNRKSAPEDVIAWIRDRTGLHIPDRLRPGTV